MIEIDTDHEDRRCSLRRYCARAAAIAGFAAGAWLVGSGGSTASADTPSVPVPVVSGLLGAVHHTVDPVTSTVPALSDVQNDVAPVAAKPAASVSAKPAMPESAKSVAPITKVTDKVVIPVEKAVSSTWKAVAPVVRTVADAASPVVKTAVSVAAPVVTVAGPAVQVSTKPVVASARAVAIAVNPMASAVKPVATALRPVVSAVKPITSAVRPVVGAVSDSVDSVVDALVPILNALHPILVVALPVTTPVVTVLDPVTTVLHPVTTVLDPVVIAPITGHIPGSVVTTAPVVVSVDIPVATSHFAVGVVGSKTHNRVPGATVPLKTSLHKATAGTVGPGILGAPPAAADVALPRVSAAPATHVARAGRAAVTVARNELAAARTSPSSVPAPDAPSPAPAPSPVDGSVPAGSSGTTGGSTPAADLAPSADSSRLTLLAALSHSDEALRATLADRPTFSPD